MLVMITSFLIPIFLQRFRLHIVPVVVAEIVAGIILGKSGFNFIHLNNWLDIISSLGFIFLMFLSGLEIDFRLLFQKQKKAANKAKEPNSLFVALSIFIGVLIISYLLSLMFKQIHLTKSAMFLTLVISTISLGIVVPALRDANISKLKIGQTILLTAVVGDLATMVLLTVFASVFSKGNQNTWLILILFGAGVIFYFLLQGMKKLPYVDKLAKGNVQIDTRAIFTLIIALVAISETVGAESILGAFLAGALVSLLSPNPEMVRKLDSFGYGFFIPTFFVMVGAKMELQDTLTNPKTLLLIPLLLVAMYVAKVIPTLILKKWYTWDRVIGSGLLLSSKLTLVIAATSIGTKLGIISATQSSALILVGVLTSIVSPILFKAIFPKQQEDLLTVSILGANEITLPVAIELVKQDYKVVVYGNQEANDRFDHLEESSHLTKLVLNEFSIQELDENKAFDNKIVVIATPNEKLNVDIASYAKNKGMEHVIVRAENPILHDQLIKNEGYGVFSTLYSSKVLLKAMIMNPSLMRLITDQDGHIKEIKMRNWDYSGVTLRSLPFLGNALVLQIIRNDEVIIPHGNTKLLYGDRILINGDEEQLEVFAKEFK
ncbi:cation:proton antiporter [Pullulanibacillus sp. KACC 23026]|uniref:cation:proton antiporter family protein n=1 Tax=Pullulanibacillus sp. KACC 23026 TaxID=3028315 RepID=UPI0023AEAA04|nr:cation:proton antiporter family protein [Pullulanibacillus sp. KACC 23026]WEG15050.1 cation:proton antiporter [Pullulanibacillus sp. KACC 23026]